MSGTTLIVPGLDGSGDTHWQTWLEHRVAGACRLTAIDLSTPVLARWASAVRDLIDHSSGSVWLVAHSYGCLAAVIAGADRRDRVAGALLVAPADPDRFTATGFHEAEEESTAETLTRWLPKEPLGFPCIMVISSNDPWLKTIKAAYWANAWGSHIVSVGAAGHINAASGYGPWPQGLEILHSLQRLHADYPLGAIEEYQYPCRGRRGLLSKLRHHTRQSWDVAFRKQK